MVVNLSITSQKLATALEEVATPPLGVEGEDTFDAIADQPVSKTGRALRTRPTHSASLPSVQNTVREQIGSSPAFVEDVVVRLFGDVSELQIEAR